MIRLRPSASGRALRHRVRSRRAWYYPASLLATAVIAAVLLAIPSADATDAPGNSAKPPALPTLSVVVVGDFFSYGYASSADPALRLSVPPTLAALNQVQLANHDVQIHVLFIPVRESTWTKLYKSSGSGKPPLINAVKDARVVIVGVGADLPRFATSLRTVLFGTHVSAKKYSPLMGLFKKGSYQQEETAFLEDIAAREASGGAMVTLGYPTVQHLGSGSGRTWWSPLSWSTVSSRQARQTNRLVSALDAQNAAATRAAGTSYQDLSLLYADPSAMASGASARGAQATALKETLVGNTLLPFVTQAVNDELTAMHLPASGAVSPITPNSRWELSIQMPTGIKAPVPHASSRPGKRPPTVTRVAPTRQRVTNAQVAQRNNRRAPVRIHVPAIPAPPAPIPKPIAPLDPPKAVGGGGAGSGGAGTGQVAGNTSPGAAGGTTPPAGATTSSGGGTTSPSTGGTTSPSTGGTTSIGSPSSGYSSPNTSSPSGSGYSSSGYSGGGSSSGGYSS